MNKNDLLTVDSEKLLRIIQETVPGKQISLAHIIGGPKEIVYRKLGLNPDIDYDHSAIGIMNITPPESAVIAADIAVKAGDINLGFVDRFSGSLIITGYLSDVETSMTEICDYFRNILGFACCDITRR
ncbi:BMC domain-containing protein [Fusicatenibacter saccharivorans]|uniref:BMC domain-containing protein n=1 Tax=Fusicatenibacter saccharivorans TaxID=1150298 RepID=UPI003D06962B